MLKRAVKRNSVRVISLNQIRLFIPIIERLSKEWTAPIYAFFHATPVVKYISARRVHGFQCLAKQCMAKNGREVRRYLDTSDRKSTSNLRKHAKVCWGSEEIDAADQTKNADAARRVIDVSKFKDGTLTASFMRIGKGKITYSHRQRNVTETRCVIPSYPCPTLADPRSNLGRQSCVGFVRA